MTYPPPGGENPQYQLQPEPQQPSDPYMQGYNSTPPPGNYYQQQPPQYSQPQSQPMMPPPVGAQPGYPSAPGSVLPPPIPPAKEGGNLGVILAVIVGLVVVLGVAAVLIIPGMVNDEGGDQAGGGDTAASEEPSKDEETTEAAPEPTEEVEETSPAGGATFGSWGAPSSSEDYDPASPEGVAIAYQVAQNTGDDATMQSLVSSSPTDDMAFDLEYEMDDTTDPYPYPYWGMSRELDDGTVQAWSGWTLDDSAPTEADDVIGGYTYTLVEEGGAWKLYDVEYGLIE